MLYEAFYPVDKLDNKPSKIFYGFVEDRPVVNLVVFDAQAPTTSILSLSPENQAELAYRILKTHVYGVQAKFIKVIFLRKYQAPDEYVGECWSIAMKNLIIGLTDKISLCEKVELDQGQIEHIFNELKKKDYGDFDAIFNT